MTNTPKLLGEGQLLASKSTIYTVPADTRTIIRTITLAHVAGGTQTINLYVKTSGGTSRRVSRAVIETDEFAHGNALCFLRNAPSCVRCKLPW